MKKCAVVMAQDITKFAVIVLTGTGNIAKKRQCGKNALRGGQPVENSKKVFSELHEYRFTNNSYMFCNFPLMLLFCLLGLLCTKYIS
ncbi:MAG TPA: hypothetical protein DIV41_05435 [Ruminococcaceae bacterium]|jgi:hypothetical protein|nr:hypothetical protein [Oscillospiraceae bacterium]